MSTPDNEIVPASGFSNPAIIRNTVVLPEPDGPSIAKNSPSPMSRLTSSAAVTAPKRLVSPRSESATVDEMGDDTVDDMGESLDKCRRVADVLVRQLGSNTSGSFSGP